MKLSRVVVAGLVGGATLVGSAWAGTGLVPVPLLPEPESGELATESVEAHAVAGAGPAAAGTPGLHVGAAKVSMTPRPDDYGGRWEQDAATCTTMDPAVFEQLADVPGHLAAAGSPWPENPDCIYMGGFGIGPMNPAVAFDTEHGLWIRSLAIADGEDTVVLTVVDAEGYLWDYANKCADCGTKQLREELGAELGIDELVVAATHSHASPDLIGGWGFVPDWYLQQVADGIRESVRSAVAALEPARIQTGEVLARGHNNERRETYRSAEEQQLTWLRAVAQRGNRTIATLGAFAAHPTTVGTNDGVAHADWVGLFERRLEERFGGIGFHFMTGLGNMSAVGGTDMGTRLADLVPAQGWPVDSDDLRLAHTTWIHPTTNVPLTALGLPGFFDRRFVPGPASVQTGKSPDTAPCASASPAGVELPVSAIRLGSALAITTGPGELFANLTNTIKERSGAAVTMALAQANDALGYMPQSFELNPIGQQGLGFVAGGVLVVNYEDSYAVDRCVGDAVLEHTLELLDTLR